METLKEILKRKFGWDDETAEDELGYARDLVEGYLADGDFSAAEDVVIDQFGLESDYVMELMGM